MKRSTRLILFFLAALASAALVYADAVSLQTGLALAAVAPFPTNPELIAAALAYRNRRLIADLVMPRVTVNTQEYKYYQWTKEQGFTIPDTRVGRTSQPNRVEFTAAELAGMTQDYALDDPIPQADLDNAPPGINPRARAVEGLTDLIMLDREKRVADKVFSAATYPAGNKVTLAGTSQWSDPASDPIGDIMAGLDTPLVRPNVMVLGQAVWTALRTHPDIMKAVNATAGDKGAAPASAVAELFELDAIHVGQAFLNTAKKGQAATFARVWGKHAALLYIDSLADPARSASRVTFAFTPQWGTRIAGSQRDPNIGMRGGEIVRVGESVDEKIVAADVGYFIENAAA